MADRYCYCHTCSRLFHYLGIARHRAAHRDRLENCTIRYSKGDTYDHNYANPEAEERQRHS